MKLKVICFIQVIIYVLSLRVHASDIESIGPYGGRFKCIEISKSNPEILYAGTYFGGIYKSVNCGANWQYLGFRGNKIISSIATDCNNSNSVYFSWYSIEPYIPGLMKSNDGGLTWEELSYSARVVATSSKISNLVFVGSGGIYKSTDGGYNFKKIDYQFGLNNIHAITTDPSDSSIIYVGTDNAIYKSTNFGDDWIKLRNTYAFSTYPAYVNDISVSAINNNIILVATSHDGLLISSDGGINWRKKNFGLQVHGAFCDNINENVIYAAHLSGFEISTDLGTSFQELKDGRFKGGKFSQNIFYLIEEDEGTILKSTDKGLTWSNAINGISNANVNSLILINNELFSIAKTGYSTKLLKYSNTVWYTILSESVGAKIFKNESNQHIYMLGGWNYFSKSKDICQTWEKSSDGLPYCSPVDLAINNDTLYLACSSAFEGLTAGVYKSIDEGDNWFLSSEGLPLVERYYLNISKLSPVDIYSICINKNNPKNLYAGGYQDLFESNNSGANWSKVYTFDNSYVWKILVDPNSSNIIYIIAGSSINDIANTLYKSTNNGNTFIGLNCGLKHVNCLFFDYSENLLYVGGKNGVVRSYDKGSTWERIGNNWANSEVSCLTKKISSDKIYVGTKESGIYKIDIPETINSNSLPHDFILNQNYPNPFNSNTMITFLINKPSNVKLEIYNQLGQCIQTLFNDFLQSGYYQIPWTGKNYNGNDVASGVYIYCLIIENQYSQSKKMLLIR